MGLHFLCSPRVRERDYPPPTPHKATVTARRDRTIQTENLQPGIGPPAYPDAPDVWHTRTSNVFKAAIPA